jgi:hypothetical protein
MTDDEKTMLKARAHCTVIAATLRHRVGPMNAAGLLLGGACGILTTEYGNEQAARHLRELANEIESDDSADDQAAPKKAN